MKIEKERFYEWLHKAYHKNGVLCLPKQVDRFYDGKKLPESHRNLTFQLENGMYGPFMMTNKGMHLVCEELKRLIENNTPQDGSIEFAPAQAVSELYGNRTYYIMNFIRIYGYVIDQIHSRRVPETGDITVPYYLYDKLEGLVLFKAEQYSEAMIISWSLRRLIKRNNLDTGTLFRECHYATDD